MPFDIGSLAMGAANNVIGTGLGLMLEKHNDRRQLRQQDKLNAQQEQMSKRLGDYNQANQLAMWKATGPVGQMEQLKKAGLNPGLIYGMGGAGGATTGSSNASASGGGAPSGGGEILGMQSAAMNLALLKAQKENIEADTKKKLTDAELTSGAQTENINADTANKIADNVIKSITGEDMRSKWNDVTKPNRGIEADTYQKELEARGGVAHNTWELWAEGKLKDKSNAEIESLLLGNAKSRAETKNIIKMFDMIEANLKGQNLSNKISELELQLQQQTGIDGKSPWFLKMLGRLFVGLGGFGTLDAMK